MEIISNTTMNNLLFSQAAGTSINTPILKDAIGTNKFENSLEWKSWLVVEEDMTEANKFKNSFGWKPPLVEENSEFKNLQDVLDKIQKIRKICKRYNINFIDAIFVLLTDAEKHLAKKLKGVDLGEVEGHTVLFKKFYY